MENKGAEEQVSVPSHPAPNRSEQAPCEQVLTRTDTSQSPQFNECV